MGVMESEVSRKRTVCVTPKGIGVGSGVGDGSIDGAGDIVLRSGAGVQPNKVKTKTPVAMNRRRLSFIGASLLLNTEEFQ
jgi:hypothetical protein